MEILNDYELIPTIDAVVNEQAEIYALPAAAIEDFLQQHKWNTDRLADIDLSAAVGGGSAAVGGGSAAVGGVSEAATAAPQYPAAGVAASRSSGRAPSHPISFCPICTESDDVQGHTLTCGHAFCTECMTGQIKAAVDGGPTCVRIACLAHKCPTIIPRAIITDLLKAADDDDTAADTLKKYQGHVIRDFISNYGRKGIANQRLLFCTNPACNKVAVVPYSATADDAITCPCGATMCAQCGGEYHAPCSCLDAKRWTAKGTDEGETVKWLAVNTKACPKCHVNIEKNQGCNHMTCRKCRHEFCWICFADWKGHTYGCKAEPVLSADVAASRSEMERYAKYYMPYQNHANALKYAVGLPAYTGAEDYYLATAKAAIIRARRMCKYAYVFMYYLSADTTLGPLFDDYFKRFEGETDALHERLERRGLLLDDCFTLARFAEYQADVITRTGELVRNLNIFNTMLASVVDAGVAGNHKTTAAYTPQIEDYDLYSDDEYTYEDDD